MEGHTLLVLFGFCFVAGVVGDMKRVKELGLVVDTSLNSHIPNTFPPTLHLATYAQSGQKRYPAGYSQQVADVWAKTGWFKTSVGWEWDSFPEDVRKAHTAFVTNPRNRIGAGYWIWKSFLIKETLKNIPDGDVLIFLDVGCSINQTARSRLDYYLKQAVENDVGIMGFQMHHLEYQYTKGDTAGYLGIADMPEIFETGQLVGGLQVIQNKRSSRDFVDVWMKCLTVENYHLLDNSPSVNFPDHSGFKAHRNDQSIFSILGKLNKIAITDDETWTGLSKNMVNPLLANRLGPQYPASAHLLSKK